MNKKDLLSTLWVFVTFNYLYCDLMGLMDAHYLKQYLTGTVDGLNISSEFLLYAAFLMEVPIAMILLSKILPNQANAIANLMASFIKTMVMVITLFIGSVSIYYMFFAVIEITTTLFIGWYSWCWLRAKPSLVPAVS